MAWFITYWFEILLLILAAVPSIILFVIRGRISHWFAKDLKKYEQQLEILKLQKSLQYSTIYAERATIIKDLYVMLARLIEAKQIVKEVKFANKEQERSTYMEYGELLRQLYIYNMEKGIYLPQSTSDKLGAFAGEITKEISIKQLELGDLPADYKRRIDEIPENDLRVIFRELRADFQELLGIIDK